MKNNFIKNQPKASKPKRSTFIVFTILIVLWTVGSIFGIVSWGKSLKKAEADDFSYIFNYKSSEYVYTDVYTNRVVIDKLINEFVFFDTYFNIVLTFDAGFPYVLSSVLSFVERTNSTTSYSSFVISSDHPLVGSVSDFSIYYGNILNGSSFTDYFNPSALNSFNFNYGQDYYLILPLFNGVSFQYTFCYFNFPSSPDTFDYVDISSYAFNYIPSSSGAFSSGTLRGTLFSYFSGDVVFNIAYSHLPTISGTRILNVSYGQDYNSGFSTGYDSGYTAGSSAGYNSGYNAGYSSGSTTGYNTGYSVGYGEGVASTGTYTFTNLIGAVVDAPIKAVRGLLSFEVFGVDMSNFVLSLFSLCIIFTIVRLIRGGA